MTIDTSPAALRALAEDKAPVRDEPDWVEGMRKWVADVRATLRALAAEKDETIRLMADPHAVHINLLRGAIAKPTLGQIVHLYGREALLTALAAEKEAGAPAPAQGPLTEVGETSRGHKLYRAPNPAGGNTYWSDEIGGGVVVWDTCLVEEETLRLALSVETGGSPAPAPDGWIPWSGGPCPVPLDSQITVRFDTGLLEDGVAGEWDWEHYQDDDDIIAYRLSKEG